MTTGHDALGQLTKAAGSTTYNYTYDTVGNILTGNGHSYTYGDTSGWKDLLTKVDGHSISYDSIGNPTTYYNGTSWTFTWAEGRRLTTASGGGNSISYTYDADGLRTSKTVNGAKHTYYYAGGKLLRETYGSNTLDFFYDSNGHAYALKHNNTVYYYITNLQGDVMSIVDAGGNVKATYKYDPYGNILTATGTMAEVNPIRYRGYYYDTESGLFYLQSRYYDPELGRFLNADAFASTGQDLLGTNMFAYCLNNTVSYIDPTGGCACVPAGGLKNGHDYTAMCPACGGCSGGVVLPWTELIEIVDGLASIVVYSVSYAYRKYTQAIKASAYSMPPESYPITHHIVPYGGFSTRDPYVRDQLEKAQSIMINADIDPEHNLHNQVVISTGYHVSLHSNDYILMVTEPIIALGDKATKEQIYLVLHYLRISIASNDPYACGY